MALLAHTPAFKVEHLRRGLYALTVFGASPNPNGRHLVVWHYGNRRSAFARLAQLAPSAQAPPAQARA